MRFRRRCRWPSLDADLNSVYDSQDGLMAAFLAVTTAGSKRVARGGIGRFIRMLIAYEDRWFFRHFGVNPLAMGRAIIPEPADPIDRLAAPH